MTAENISVNELFSMSIDDLADLPSFEVPVPGSYVLDTSIAMKQINGRDTIEATFVVVELVEPVKPLEDGVRKPVVGDKFNMLFQLNEIGLRKFKKLIAPIAIATGEKRLQNLVSGSVKDLQIAALVGHRVVENKETGEKKVYGDVSNVSVA